MQKCILVVDDDDMNLMRTKRILGKEYNVLFASSGMEALKRLKTENVDLVLLDIEMPEMDGHRLTKLVKADEATAHIPIIIFSSLSLYAGAPGRSGPVSRNSFICSCPQ